MEGASPNRSLQPVRGEPNDGREWNDGSSICFHQGKGNQKAQLITPHASPRMLLAGPAIPRTGPLPSQEGFHQPAISLRTVELSEFNGFANRFFMKIPEAGQYGSSCQSPLCSTRFLSISLSEERIHIYQSDLVRLTSFSPLYKHSLAYRNSPLKTLRPLTARNP